MLNTMCALAVIACAKELNLENLKEMYRLIGVEPREEELGRCCFCNRFFRPTVKEKIRIQNTYRL